MDQSAFGIPPRAPKILYVTCLGVWTFTPTHPDMLQVRGAAASTASFAQTARNINSAGMTSTALRTPGDRITSVLTTPSAVKRIPITVRLSTRRPIHPPQQDTYLYQAKMNASRRTLSASTAIPTCSAETWGTAPLNLITNSTSAPVHRYATSLSTSRVPVPKLQEAVFTADYGYYRENRREMFRHLPMDRKDNSKCLWCVARRISVFVVFVQLLVIKREQIVPESKSNHWDWNS
ncbi:hypothetical protein Cfor_11747 [Coptotermes formosanus]|uniref:Uncharacterized protein n=1 Tax=Coptotermes formosanus TaxID=36987 RepID=A0A6L2PGB2_COPFO|nr:hypothetical protein Cfor_11747 [Coptotermes formosanus]